MAISLCYEHNSCFVFKHFNEIVVPSSLFTYTAAMYGICQILYEYHGDGYKLYIMLLYTADNMICINLMWKTESPVWLVLKLLKDCGRDVETFQSIMHFLCHYDKQNFKAVYNIVLNFLIKPQ